MPEEGQSMSVLILKPYRGYQLLLTVALFQLGSFMEATPKNYMSLTACYTLMIIATIYLLFITIAIINLREGDIIRINWMFMCALIGIPLFILAGITFYVLPKTDKTFWAVKVTTLFCFLLAGSFFIEISTVLRKVRR